MSNTVLIDIGGIQHVVGLTGNLSLVIREDDEICIVINSSELFDDVSVFIEDAEVATEVMHVDDIYQYRTPKSRFFSESFGQSFIRIYIEDLTFFILLDVRAKKMNAEQATKMLMYLSSKHENIIKTCFSRSTAPAGFDKDSLGLADPEQIVGAAESFVSKLISFRTELLTTKRTRLVPVKQSLWKAKSSNFDIDPVNIIENLDSISPTFGEGDVFLRGRNFDLGDMDVLTLRESADVEENRIILGGLYSVRKKLEQLIDRFHSSSLTPADIEGYESFERLLLNVTAVGMERRCKLVIEKCIEFIKLLETRLAVVYVGELRPIMTPYARTSKIYRVLYKDLYDWYALGAPYLGTNAFLLKLKSLSKIYELYVLFFTIDYFLKSEWTIVAAKEHHEFSEFIPRELIFRRGTYKVTFSYDRKIMPFNLQDTEDMALCDVWHRNVGEYKYWRPDYVIKFESDNGDVRYIILDAKYSTEGTVRNIHLPNIIDKYYWGMSVYNKRSGILTNNEIVGVIALFPLSYGTEFFQYKRRSNLKAKIFSLPIMGASCLSLEDHSKAEKVFDVLIDAVHCSIVGDTSQALMI